MSGSGGKTSNYQQEVGEGGGVELATTAWNKTNLGEGGGGKGEPLVLHFVVQCRQKFHVSILLLHY